jgi:hypothetical protein
MRLANSGDKYDIAPGRLLHSSVARGWSGLFADSRLHVGGAPTLSCSLPPRCPWCCAVKL